MVTTAFDPPFPSGGWSHVSRHPPSGQLDPPHLAIVRKSNVCERAAGTALERLKGPAHARKVTRKAKQAAFEEARRQKRLNAEALAASGDAAAAAELQRLQDWEGFRRSMRSLVRGPGPRMRLPEDADHIANPTRILGLLERRGLIKRRAVRDRGAGAWLTDAGRIIGFQVLEERVQDGTPAAAQAAASDTAR